MNCGKFRKSLSLRACIAGVAVCGARRMSLPLKRLRPRPTAAHAAPLLHLPPAAQRLAAIRPSCRAIRIFLRTANGRPYEGYRRRM